MDLDCTTQHTRSEREQYSREWFIDLEALEREDVADREWPEVVTASIVFGAEPEEDLALTFSVRRLLIGVSNSGRCLETHFGKSFRKSGPLSFEYTLFN